MRILAAIPLISILSITLLTSCTTTEIEKRTTTLFVVDQGAKIPGVIKVLEDTLTGILIKEDGTSDGVPGTVKNTQGLLLVGPDRYIELRKLEKVLAKIADDHPELRREIQTLLNEEE